MVHGRDTQGEAEEFGVSGYVYRNVFLMYDRKTMSLWYPLNDSEWTAIAGERRGQTVPIQEHPGITTLGAWRDLHPDTVVLLGSKKKIESASAGQP